MTATKSLKLAEMRVFEARRNMLPTATIVAEETYGRVNARSYAGRKQYIEGQQPVFHGGELYYAVKQAEANLEVTRNEYAKQKNELVHTVKKAYYTLAKAKENLKIQKELKKEADLIFSSVSKASEAGVITKVESLNVSSQSSQIDYQIISAEGDVEVAELILKQAMNVDPKQNINTMPLPEFVKVDVDYGDALRTAYLSRPEMKINRFLIDYYDFGVRVAKGKGWPKIDLLGSWGLAKEEYTPADNCWDIDTGPNGTGAQGYQAPQRKLEQQWYAGVKASMPLWGSTLEYSHTREQWVPVVSAYQGTQAATNSVKFKILDKLDYYSDVQLADVDLSRARQEYIKIKNEITLEVREACFSYQKALVQLDTTADKIKYQKTDVDVAKVKRGLDEASDSNVIDSMIKLAQEEFSHAQAVTDCHTSLSAINKAVGIEDRFKDTARRGVSAATDNVS
jgi:outer membrane protein TolC